MAKITGKINNITSSEITIHLKDDESSKFAEAVLSRRFSNMTLEEAELLYVHDGDTIKVMYQGKEEWVRLIGVDAPDLVNSEDTDSENEPYSEEARDHLRNLLDGRKYVYLEFDTELRDSTKNERLLAYVYLDRNRRIDEMLNSEMVRQGFATSMSVAPNTRYSEVFTRLEVEARRAERNMWSTENRPAVLYVNLFSDLIVTIKRIDWPSKFNYEYGTMDLFYLGSNNRVSIGDQITAQGDFINPRAVPDISLDESALAKKNESLDLEAKIIDNRENVQEDTPVSSNIPKTTNGNKSTPEYPMDHELRLGYSKFTVPPLSIDVQRMATIHKHPTIRNKGSIKENTGHSDTKIIINLYFPNLESINDPENGLRALIAQFKRTPFVPVDNYYLNIIHDIWNVALYNLVITTDPEFPDSLNVQLTLVKFNHMPYIPSVLSLGEAINYDIFKWYFQKDLIYEYNKETMMPYPDKRPGKLGMLGRLNTSDFNFWVIPEDELERAKEISDRADSEEFEEQFEASKEEFEDIKADKYLIDILFEIKDIFWSRASLGDQKTTKKEIEEFVEKSIKEIKEKRKEEEWMKKVKLSSDQIAVYAAWPEASRISLNSERLKKELEGVFDTSGPLRVNLVNSGEFSTLVTKARDLYALYDGYFKTLQQKRSEAFRGVRYAELGMEPFHIEGKDRISLVDIQCSYENILSSFQVKQLEGPTHQFLGSQDTYIRLDFECRGEDAVSSLRQLMDYTQMIAREYRSVVKSGFLRMENDLVNLFGIEHILIEDLNVYTVPEFPDLFRVQMTIVDFNLAQEKIERHGSIIGRLDGSGRFIYSGEEYNDFGSIDEARESLRQTGTESSRLQAYHIEKFMGEFELYPDLDLPTYEELEIAYNSSRTEEFIREYPHFALIKPDDPGAKYADPDFYFMRAENKYDGITQVLADPEKGEMTLHDNAGGEIRIRPPRKGEDPQNSGWRVPRNERDRRKLVQFHDVMEEVEEEKVAESEDEAILVSTMENPDLEKLTLEYSNISRADIIREIIKAVNESNKREIESKRKIKENPVRIDHDMVLWLANKLSGINQFERDEDDRLIPKYIDNRYGIFMIPEDNYPSIIYENAESKSPTRVSPDHIKYDFRVNIKVGVEMLRQGFLDATGPGNNNLGEQQALGQLVEEHAVKQIQDLELSINKLIKKRDEITEKSLGERVTNIFRSAVAPVARYSKMREETEKTNEIDRQVKDLYDEVKVYKQIIQDAKRVQKDGISSYRYDYSYSDGIISRMVWNQVIKNKFIIDEDQDIRELWSELDAVVSLRRSTSRVSFSLPELYNNPDSFSDQRVEDLMEIAINSDSIREMAQGHFSTRREIERLEKLTEASENIREVINLPEVEGTIESRTVEQAFADMWDDMKKYDMSGRMVRAFPSFHMFIIEEGRILKRWKLWDNFYGFSSISNIEIVRSRKIAADTAVISLSNIFGGIANESVQGDFESKDINLDFFTWVSNFVGQGRLDDEQLAKHDKPKSNLFIREGSRIHLRIGYGSNARRLPIVFNGSVTEYQVGDIVEIIAQGDGIELSNVLPYGPNATSGSFGFGAEPRNILGPMLTNQGTWKNFVKSVTGGRYGWGNNAHGVEHFGDFWYRNGEGKSLGELGQNLHLASNSESELYAEDINGSPQYAKVMLNPFAWYQQAKESNKLTIDLYDKTIWDVAQICSLATPNYITAVHPFGFRSTLFFGKAHHGLCYDYDIKTRGDYMDDKETTGYNLIKEEGLYFREIRKPFQQWHVLDSVHDIIGNNIKASSQGVYNTVIARYHAEPAKILGNVLQRGTPQEDMVVAHADRDILPRAKKTTVVDTHIKCRGNWAIGWIPIVGAAWGTYHNFNATKAAAIAVAQSTVRDYMKDMYKGNIVIIGDATLKPHDGFYLWDYYNEMYGIAEIEQVVHHISAETGFITTVTPDAAVAVADPERHRLWGWVASAALGATSKMVITNMANYTLAVEKSIQFALSTKSFLSGSRVGQFLIKAGSTATRVASGINIAGFNIGAGAITAASRATGGVARAVMGAINIARLGAAAAAGSALYSAGLTLIATAALSIVAHSVEKMLRRYFDLSQCIVMSPLTIKRKPFTAAMTGSSGVIIGTANALSNLSIVDDALTEVFKARDSLGVAPASTPEYQREQIGSHVYNLFFAHTVTQQQLKEMYKDRIEFEKGLREDDEGAGYR